MADSQPLELKHFMERVLAINPRYGNIDADGIPGMGQAHPGASAVEKLRQMAHAFAQSYLNPATGNTEIEARAHDVEAALQVVATMSVTPSENIEPLLTELDGLVSQKTGA